MLCSRTLCPKQKKAQFKPSYLSRRNLKFPDDKLDVVPEKNELFDKNDVESDISMNVNFQIDADEQEMMSQGSRLQKRRWGNAVATCVEMQCSGANGIDRLTCAIVKCHQSR